MIADGVLDRFPKPDIVLGQHVSSTMPAGVLGVRAGTQMAAAEGVTIVLHGRGGHGSRPHETIDPVVMAAATVMRLQTIVSREVGPQDVAVLTVGSIRAGLKHTGGSVTIWPRGGERIALVQRAGLDRIKGCR